MKNKQAFYSITGNIVYLVAQWALTVVVVRFSDDFYAAGLLSLAMTISNVFYVVACYGLRAFQVSDIKHEYADQCYLLSRIVSIAAAIIACVVYVFVKGYNAISVYCVLVYMLYKCFEAASDVLYGVFQMNDDFEHICASMCVKGVLSLGAFTAALMLGKPLTTALWAMVAVALAMFLLYDMYWCRKYVHPLMYWTSDNWKHTMRLLAVSFPAMVVLFCQPLLMSIPRLYFEKHFSTELLGVYSAVSAPTVAISTFVSCAMTPYIPLFAEYYFGGDARRLRRLTYGSLAFSLGIGLAALLGGTLLGEWALNLLYGEGVRGYVDVFQLVIMVTTFCAVMMCLDSLYIAMRKLVPLAAILLLGCLLCQIITPYFVNTFAMKGITYALMIALAFQIIAAIALTQFYFRRMPRGGQAPGA